MKDEKRRAASRRRGFTLVELLVVITIIGILVSLLLPAVQSAREQAHRLQCQNNLKQLGIALQSYHEQNKQFPASAVWKDSSGNLSLASINDGNNASGLRENWVIILLPFIEQKPLFQSFARNTASSMQTNTQPGDMLPIPNAANAAARGANLQFMLCPSDTYNRTPFDGTGSGNTNQMNQPGQVWGRGNYGANASEGYMFSGGTDGSNTGWRSSVLQGVMGANDSCRIEDIHDGTSNTFLLLELRAGIVPFDTRGTWAMSGACPSALWAFGYISDANGPNSPMTQADDERACSDIQNAVGGAAQLIALNMSCYSGNSPDVQQTARSMHAAGINTVFCDGSVHFISDFIDKSAGWTTPTPWHVWDKLILSNDHQPIDASTY